MSLLLFFMTFSLGVFAQEEKKVEEAVETMRKAMVDANASVLESIAAEDLTYGHSSGTIEDKKTFVESIVSGKSDFVSIELSNQTVKVVGNTALVRHILFAETNNGGQAGTVKLSILLVWQKQKGKWKLLARQAVKV